MHSSKIAAAIAASIDDALAAGRPTAELRHELAALERKQRAEAAEAAAQERARRAEQEERERDDINVRATALLDGIKARIASKTASLVVPSAPTVRRYPDGSFETVETVTVTMEHEHA